MSGDHAYDPFDLARKCGAHPPTPEQAAVIAAPAAPSVVIAGAGSGKSETMARRVVWLVANGYARPEHVLGLTFTRKAARELGVKVRGWLDRLRALPEFGTHAGAEVLAGDPMVSTYHAYAGRIYRMHALREGAEPGARLVTPAVQWQLAHRVVARYDGPMDAVEWTPSTVTAAVLELAGEMSEHLVSPADLMLEGERWEVRAAAGGKARPALVTRLLKNQRVREQLLPLVEHYQRAKLDAGLLDFDDQMAAAATLASRHPAVGRMERSLFSAVLLDEYQDTSHSQLTLLRSLFPGGFPVMAVGDPAQSIYSWRGATAGNLRRFPDDFPTADGTPTERLHLTWSFRNAEHVLHVANQVVEPFEDDVSHRLVPAPVLDDPGRVECALLETVDDEADWLGSRVAGLLDTGDWRPRDVAVLVRRRTQIPRLREAMERRDVPVEVVGLTGLLTVPSVADVVSTLRVLYDPTANPSLVRLLAGPRWRIGARDLVALGRRARHLVKGERAAADDTRPDPFANAVLSELDVGSLVDALDDLGPQQAYSAQAYARFRALAAELRVLRERAHLPLPELVAEVERTLRLDVEVAARPGVDPRAARADLDAFAEEAARFSRDDERPTLGAFLAYLDAAEEQESGLEIPQVGESDSVKLMTVHAAKGLEWPVVFVPGLATGSKSSVFPARAQTSTSWTDNARLLPFPLRGDARDLPHLSGVSRDDAQRYAAACAARQESEERRLFYVAVTRSQRLLSCTGYHWGTGVTPLGPSVFLEEVRAVCEAGTGRVACWTENGDGDNPLLEVTPSAQWPLEPDPGAHREALRAARLVDDASATLPIALASQADTWSTDVELLLAELAENRRSHDVPVELPEHLSVSALVSLARDADRFALDLRRPVPHKPEPQARRGTAFHRYLEARWGQQRLFGPDDEPGAGDVGAASDADFEVLRDRFEQSAWADRTPLDVEVPFEMHVEGVLVRGRMDAVFTAPTGYEVVDWKTGSPPTPDEEQAAAVQLAAYRLAWSRLHDVPLDQVRASFHYVRSGRTIRPVDLLDAEGLANMIRTVPTAP